MKLLSKIIIKYISKLIQVGKIKSALNISKKYLKSPFENNYYQGICYYEIGDFSQAQTHLELAWKLNKNSAVALILGEVYIQQDNWGKAHSVLKPYQQVPEAKQLIAVIQGSPRDKQDYKTFTDLLRQAMHLMHRREFSKSIQCLEKALSYSKDKGKIYNQIGGIYFNFLKDRTKAVQYFKKAYEISPTNKVFKLNYAKAELQ